MTSRTNEFLLRVSDEELAVIEQKQKQAKMTSREAYIRKMLMEGQVLVLEVPELRKVSSLLAYCSNNLNQIARRVNSGNRPELEELQAIRSSLDAMTHDVRLVIEKLNVL